jgi:hypothetical protein
MAAAPSWSNPQLETTSLVQQLRLGGGQSLPEVLIAVKTLLDICRRLITQHQNPRVHSLRVANPSFDKVGRFALAVAILPIIGFENTTDGFWVAPKGCGEIPNCTPSAVAAALERQIVEIEADVLAVAADRELCANKVLQESHQREKVRETLFGDRWAVWRRAAYTNAAISQHAAAAGNVDDGSNPCEVVLELSSKAASPRLLRIRSPSWSEQRSIEQGRLLSGTTEEFYGCTGARVWDSSLLLAHIADRRPPGWWVGRRVLELGCGCGAAGLAAAALGADVTLTDLVPNLAHRNAQALFGGRERAPAVEQLAWGAGGAQLACVRGRGPFDVILAADVLYNAADWAALASSIEVVRAKAAVGIMGCL